jgi:hypothetical protein|tara:strand:- start:2147 stop:2407 length:261 start_codon:yes stop_codon:yes gene_type:complete
MTNRFGKRMRVSKGISYNCMKCNKKWDLNAVVNIKGINKLIINPNSRPHRRNVGHCSCGAVFDVPTIHINKLKSEYESSSQQRVVQ